MERQQRQQQEPESREVYLVRHYPVASCHCSAGADAVLIGNRIYHTSDNAASPATTEHKTTLLSSRRNVGSTKYTDEELAQLLKNVFVTKDRGFHFFSKSSWNTSVFLTSCGCEDQIPTEVAPMVGIFAAFLMMGAIFLCLCFITEVH
jgi:hypothetical protein